MLSNKAAKKTCVKSLGEIALRVENLDKMQQFYENALGLSLFRKFEKAVFFKIADGFAGHTQILALFDRNSSPGFSGINSKMTTIDHLAFTILPGDYEAEKTRLEQLGLKVETAEHSWVHWRSLYLTDPEGNCVELVCYDERVK